MSKNWKCQSCKRVHRKNPSRCKKCGHTVFQQTETEVESVIGRVLNKVGL